MRSSKERGRLPRFTFMELLNAIAIKSISWLLGYYKVNKGGKHHVETCKNESCRGFL